MNRITVAVFSLAFLQLVSSQTACNDAFRALTNNPTCISKNATVCMGTCRTLYDNIISSCDNTVSSNSYI